MIGRPGALGVTVLLPVFLREGDQHGAARFVAAIESICSQEFPEEWEILVVDDGSSFDLERLTKEIDVPHLVIVRQPVNRGIVSALNVGLKRARMPLIARIDADDTWLDGKIAAQLPLFAKEADLTISATGMTTTDPQGRSERIVRGGQWADILTCFVNEGSPFPHGSVIGRTDIYRLLGGYSHDPRVRHCEDYALWGVWLRFFKPRMLETSLYAYTLSEGSLSSRNRATQLEATELVRRQFAQLPWHAIPSALTELAAAIDSSVLDAGMLAYKMWRFGKEASLPRTAIEPLRLLMPDRHLQATEADRWLAR